MVSKLWRLTCYILAMCYFLLTVTYIIEEYKDSIFKYSFLLSPLMLTELYEAIKTKEVASINPEGRVKKEKGRAEFNMALFNLIFFNVVVIILSIIGWLN